MSLFSDELVVVRGGGDIGSGIAWRLRRSGFAVVVLELERPLTVRRTVAFSSAVADGQATIEGVTGIRVASAEEAVTVAKSGRVPVLVADGIPSFPLPVTAVVDARLSKHAGDTQIGQAPFVVGVGPGFTAGAHCHAVVETMRGHRLGRVIWEGSAAPNTGIPGTIGGASSARLLRAPTHGNVEWSVSFGDIVEVDQNVGSVGTEPVTAAIAGIVRGLISPGPVVEGLKIGDIDPRCEPEALNEISDKALSVGGGVLEAILGWMDRARE